MQALLAAIVAGFTALVSAPMELFQSVDPRSQRQSEVEEAGQRDDGGDAAEDGSNSSLSLPVRRGRGRNAAGEQPAGRQRGKEQSSSDREAAAVEDDTALEAEVAE